MIEKVLKELFKFPLLHEIWKPKGKKAKKEFDEKIPSLSYQKFKIQNFKGIDEVEIDLIKNDLVLLLGLNESGKTTILKGIEAFSFINDPTVDYNPVFFQSIRKKADVGGNTSAIITATIKLETNIEPPKTKKLAGKELDKKDIDNIESFIYELNKTKEVVISRVFPFKDGKPQRYYYQFESEHPFAKTKLSRSLALEIVNICPYIIYFEDFKDRIPEKIFVNKTGKESLNPIWYNIIDGLFYNTDSNFSIKKFKKLFSPSAQLTDDAATVETRVNATLNKTFTQKWQSLSGVKEIQTTELKFFYKRPAFFTLKIKDRDGTTYSVEERSKGALWYLSFLMKTEFRSKKLRKHSGKPVFLIDEPASNLHSTAQHNMINDFKLLAKETSIIYTTHSQYLISLENIRNTFIIEKRDGIVNAEKWGKYLNRQDAQVTYYQPLANLLNLIPNTFDIPWKECLLTEGPSDRHVLVSMYRILKGKRLRTPIYPGTSAYNLAPLISLNIGWNSNFKILLDSDNAGMDAKEKYQADFGLSDELILLPKKKIEKCLSEAEKVQLRNYFFPDNKGHRVSKKEFAAIWAIISEAKEHDSTIKKMLTPKTKKLFENLFKDLGFV